MNRRRKGMLLLLLGVLCLWMLSACVKYFPREEQTFAQTSEQSAETGALTAAEEEGFPNLPSADATKRY